MNPYSDEKIVDSWDKNAPHWTAAVRSGKIESRKLLTDRAIVEAVLSHSPASVLDIGCRANSARANSASVDDAIQRLFDVVVCNFSLLGKECVELLFSAIPLHLEPGGVFIVQTLHPVVACGDLPYIDGWREGSWSGFGSDFTDPAPWYFRTIQNWETLFTANGFHLLEVREPIHPRTHEPASIIFTGAVESING